VYAPTATGMGERSHLLGPKISLETHIQDVVGVLEWEDLSDVILVGHSYGGMLIAGAAEKAPHRIAHLVYLDALVPIKGDCVLDLLDPGVAASFRTLISAEGEGWFIPAMPTARAYGITDPDDVAWVNSKLTAQPAATFQDAIGSTRVAWNTPGTFVECLQSTRDSVPLSHQRARDRADRDENFEYVTLDSGHDAMITHPEELTTVLLGCVAKSLPTSRAVTGKR
jgi:pimeloyl-ACP methyl ester carboxylesterase